MEATTLSGRSMIFAGGIGVATPDAKTAAEAIEQGGLDFKVELRSAGYANDNGEFVAGERGDHAVVRSDTGRVFGYVGKRYTPIQNVEMFDWCDRLVDDFGAKYEAAWSLYGGKEVGLTMKFPEAVKIGGADPYDKYLLLRANHDGKGSVKAVITPVRLYCTNMLNVAMKGAVSRVTIPHLTNATSKLAKARETFELTLAYDDAFEKAMEAMIARQLDDDAFKSITENLLADANFGGREKHSSAIISLRHDSPTLQDEFRGTAYGAFQAVTEWTDWVRETKSAQGRVLDLLDGRVLRMKNAAVSALV